MNMKHFKPIGQVDILQATKEITIAYIQQKSNENDVNKEVCEPMSKIHNKLIELYIDDVASKETYKNSIKNILKESDAPLTTKEISGKVSALSKKTISVTMVRVILNREKKLFKKVDSQHWDLKEIKKNKRR